MTLVDLLNIPRVGDPQLSPDGNSVTFTLATTDWAGQSACAARLADQHRRHRASPGSCRTRAPYNARWSPDGSTIAFLLRGSVFAVPSAGGTARQISQANRRRRHRLASRRHLDLFPGARSSDRCRARTAAAARRHPRARRVPAAASVEDGGRRRHGNARHRGRLLHLRLQDRRRRQAYHRQPPPDVASGRHRQDGALEHRRRRHRARSADQEQRAGGRRRACARRVAGPVHRPRQRTGRSRTTTRTCSSCRPQADPRARRFRIFRTKCSARAGAPTASRSGCS